MQLVGSSSLIRDRTQAPRHWQHGVLATGPPGKSLTLHFESILQAKPLWHREACSFSQAQNPTNYSISRPLLVWPVGCYHMLTQCACTHTCTHTHTHTHAHLPISLPGGEVTRTLSCLPAPLSLSTATTYLSFCSVSCDPVKPLREVKVLTPAVSGSLLCLIFLVAHAGPASGARGLRLPPLPTMPTFPCSPPSPSLSHLLSQDWGLLGPSTHPWQSTGWQECSFLPLFEHLWVSGPVW